MKVKITLLSVLSVLIITHHSFAQQSLTALEEATTASTNQIPSLLKGFHYEYKESNGSTLWANDGKDNTGEVIKTKAYGQPGIVQYVFTNPSYYKTLLEAVKKKTNNNRTSSETKPSANGMSEKNVFYENANYRYGFRILSQNGKVFGYNLFVAKK